MGEQLKMEIDKLLIWSENPRHIEATENTKFSENEVINILVNTVGYRYMYNLAEDIFYKGLMGNILPVVVADKDKYLVYDGNRRISAIKILLNPSILDTANMQLRNLIDGLLLKHKDLNLEKLKTINVYSTTEEDALDIMDKTHNGIRDGIGTIPWDAYQRDKANFKRNNDHKKVDYPTAFEIVTKLGLKKSDIKEDYTSYERIFNNSVFKELFKISDYGQVDCEYLLLIYELLKKYKEEKGAGLSRIFNKSDEASKNFYEWAQPKLTPDNFITIKFNNDIIELFKGQELPVQKLQFEIIDYYGQPIEDNNYVLKNFITPDGKNVNVIDTQVTGQWYYQVTYKSTNEKLLITVKDLQSPVIMLRENLISIDKNTTITDLRDYIISGTNSRNENVISEIKILSKDNNTLLSSSGSFLNTNQCGNHTIVFEYNDPYNHMQVSKQLIINVSEITVTLSTKQENKQLLSFGYKIPSKYIDHLSCETKELINEINELSKQLSNFKHVIAASLRGLVHLLTKDYCNQKNVNFNDNISGQIKQLCDALTNDFSIGHDVKSKESWVDEVSLKNAFRALNKNEWLSNVLNCAAHSAGTYIVETEIKSAAEKISQLIVYIAILIYKEQ